MGRKKATPQQLGTEQRQQHHWNMLDGSAGQTPSSTTCTSMSTSASESTSTSAVPEHPWNLLDGRAEQTPSRSTSASTVQGHHWNIFENSADQTPSTSTSASTVRECGSLIIVQDDDPQLKKEMEWEVAYNKLTTKAVADGEDRTDVDDRDRTDVESSVDDGDETYFDCSVDFEDETNVDCLVDNGDSAEVECLAEAKPEIVDTETQWLPTVPVSTCSSESEAQWLPTIPVSMCSSESEAQWLPTVPVSMCSSESEAQWLPTIPVSTCSSESEAQWLPTVPVSMCLSESQPEIVDTEAQWLPTVPASMITFFEGEVPRRIVSQIPDSYNVCMPLYGRHHPLSYELANDWSWEVSRIKLERPRPNIKVKSKSPDNSESECPEVPKWPNLSEVSGLKECWLYVSESKTKPPMLYFELEDKQQLATQPQANGGVVMAGRRRSTAKKRKSIEKKMLGLFWFVKICGVQDPLTLLQKISDTGHKKFHVMFGEFDSTTRTMELTLYGRKDSLQKLTHPSQHFLLSPINYAMFEIMDRFYNLGLIYDSCKVEVTHQDFHELFEGVKKAQKSLKVKVTLDVKHPSLKPTLRRYQKDAVRWMLQQERCDVSKDDDSQEDDPHPLYTQVITRCGKTLYYNRQGGSLIEERPLKEPRQPGGILGDEMGLGKTVEILSLVLLHPSPTDVVPEPLPVITLDSDEEDISLDMELSAALAAMTDSELSENSALTPSSMSIMTANRRRSRRRISSGSSDNETSDSALTVDYKKSLAAGRNLKGRRRISSDEDNDTSDSVVSANNNSSFPADRKIIRGRRRISSFEENDTSDSVLTANNISSVPPDRKIIKGRRRISSLDEENQTSDSVLKSEGNPTLKRESSDSSSFPSAPSQCVTSKATSDHTYFMMQDSGDARTVTSSSARRSSASQSSTSSSQAKPFCDWGGFDSLGIDGDQVLLKKSQRLSVGSEESDSVGADDEMAVTGLERTNVKVKVKRAAGISSDDATSSANADTDSAKNTEKGDSNNGDSKNGDSKSTAACGPSKKNSRKHKTSLGTRKKQQQQHNTADLNKETIVTANYKRKVNSKRKRKANSIDHSVVGKKQRGQNNTVVNKEITTREGSKGKTNTKRKRKANSFDHNDDCPPANECAMSHFKKRKSNNHADGTVVAGNAMSTHGWKWWSEGIVGQKQLFECTCGRGEKDDGLTEGKTRRTRSQIRGKHVVQCTECGTSQHAECLHYDLTDPLRGPYKCPHCHFYGTPLPSKATLIISPFSICNQWCEEIRKHLRENSLKVFVYSGVSEQGFIQPQLLARHDVVITTYETLCKELNYVNLPHTNSEAGRRFRKPKKFMAKPTPLTAVEWWRICLDEAQMVEKVTTKTAEMALRLHSVNRWCVTGTPLNQSINDLFGLLCFIGFDPYCYQEWWKRWLYEPYLHGIKEPMFTELAKVMWRNSVKDVSDQLGIPDKTDKLYYLSFSAVEEVIYKRVYTDSSNEFLKVVEQHGLVEKHTCLDKIDKRLVARIFQPLNKLRQACCHPQAIKGSFIPIHEKMMTMEELLDNMIKKTVVECKESHRLLISVMNGEAGCLLIQDNPDVVKAVELYREVLRLSEEHKQRGQFETDKLPLIHTMFNLQQVLQTKPPGVAPTLRDGQLGEQCEMLKKEYMQKVNSEVAAVRDHLAPFRQAIVTSTNQLVSGQEWYVQVLSHAYEAGTIRELTQKVKDDIASISGNKNIHFSGAAGLQMVIAQSLQHQETARKKVLNGMRQIDYSGPVRRTQLEAAIDCCLRPTNANDREEKKCIFCELSDLLLDYESTIYDITIEKKNMAAETVDYRKGTWGNNTLEVILKSILAFAKNQHLETSVIQYGTIHMQLFESWKKEFKPLRALWVALKERVAAVDELEMAVTRMRLRLPDEPHNPADSVYVFDKAELASQKRKYGLDQILYASELRRKCGQLEYLKNLQKGNQVRDGVNPEPCVICREVLGKNWGVLVCGHCFCINCLQFLRERATQFGHHSAGHFNCPVCRVRNSTNEVSYVSTKKQSNWRDADSGEPEEEEPQCSIKGSHSTKVTAILELILHIQASDAGAKVLVFSTWVDVLKLIAHALEQNNINFTQLYDHGKKFERNVKTFKNDEDINVLLLPYHTGSNGLNLFEASHVIMVEPTLNPAQEAQAIGRVYRMGQTRETTIHRFLVKGTVEENIHSLMENTLRPAMEMEETLMENSQISVEQLVALFEKHNTDQNAEDNAEMYNDAAEQVMDVAEQVENDEQVDENAEQVDDNAEQVEQVDDNTEQVEQVDENAEQVEQVDENAEQVENAQINSDSAEQVMEVAEQVDENAEQVDEDAEQVDDNAEQENVQQVESAEFFMEVAMQVRDIVKQVRDIAEQVDENAEQVDDNVVQVDDSNDENADENAEQVDNNVEQVNENSEEETAEPVDDNTEQVDKNAEQVEDKAEQVEQVGDSDEEVDDNTEQVDDNCEQLVQNAEQVDQVDEVDGYTEQVNDNVEQFVQNAELGMKVAEQVDENAEQVDENAEQVDENVEQADECAEQIDDSCEQVVVSDFVEQIDENSEQAVQNAEQIDQNAEQVDESAEEVVYLKQVIKKAEQVIKQAEQVIQNMKVIRSAQQVVESPEQEIERSSENVSAERDNVEPMEKSEEDVCSVGQYVWRNWRETNARSSHDLHRSMASSSGSSLQEMDQEYSEENLSCWNQATNRKWKNISANTSQNFETPSQDSDRSMQEIGGRTSQSIENPSQVTHRNWEAVSQCIDTPSQDTRRNMQDIGGRTSQSFKNPSQDADKNAQDIGVSISQGVKTPSQVTDRITQDTGIKTSQSVETPSQDTNRIVQHMSHFVEKRSQDTDRIVQDICVIISQGVETQSQDIGASISQSGIGRNTQDIVASTPQSIENLSQDIERNAQDIGASISQNFETLSRDIDRNEQDISVCTSPCTENPAQHTDRNAYGTESSQSDVHRSGQESDNSCLHTSSPGQATRTINRPPEFVRIFSQEQVRNVQDVNRSGRASDGSCLQEMATTGQDTFIFSRPLEVVRIVSQKQVRNVQDVDRSGQESDNSCLQETGRKEQAACTISSRPPEVVRIVSQEQVSRVQITFRNPQEQVRSVQDTFRNPQEQARRVQDTFRNPQEQARRVQDTFRNPQEQIRSVQDVNASVLQDTFSNPHDTFRNQQDTFRKPQDTFRKPQDTFRNQQDTFTNRQDTLRKPQDTFRKPQDTFRNQQDTCRNPHDTFRKPQEQDGRLSHDSERNIQHAWNSLNPFSSRASDRMVKVDLSKNTEKNIQGAWNSITNPPRSYPLISYGIVTEQGPSTADIHPHDSSSEVFDVASAHDCSPSTSISAASQMNIDRMVTEQNPSACSSYTADNAPVVSYSETFACAPAQGYNPRTSISTASEMNTDGMVTEQDPSASPSYTVNYAPIVSYSEVFDCAPTHEYGPSASVSTASEMNADCMLTEQDPSACTSYTVNYAPIVSYSEVFDCAPAQDYAPRASVSTASEMNAEYMVTEQDPSACPSYTVNNAPIVSYSEVFGGTPLMQDCAPSISAASVNMNIDSNQFLASEINTESNQFSASDPADTPVQPAVWVCNEVISTKSDNACFLGSSTAGSGTQSASLASITGTRARCVQTPGTAVASLASITSTAGSQRQSASLASITSTAGSQRQSASLASITRTAGSPTQSVQTNNTNVTSSASITSGDHILSSKPDSVHHVQNTDTILPETTTDIVLFDQAKNRHGLPVSDSLIQNVEQESTAIAISEQARNSRDLPVSSIEDGEQVIHENTMCQITAIFDQARHSSHLAVSCNLMGNSERNTECTITAIFGQAINSSSDLALSGSLMENSEQSIPENADSTIFGSCSTPTSFSSELDSSVFALSSMPTCVSSESSGLSLDRAVTLYSNNRGHRKNTESGLYASSSTNTCFTSQSSVSSSDHASTLDSHNPGHRESALFASPSATTWGICECEGSVLSSDLPVTLYSNNRGHRKNTESGLYASSSTNTCFTSESSVLSLDHASTLDSNNPGHRESALFASPSMTTWGICECEGSVLTSDLPVTESSLFAMSNTCASSVGSVLSLDCILALNDPCLSMSFPSTVSNNPSPSISHPSTVSNNPGLSISHPSTVSNNPALSISQPSTLSSNPALSISHPATLSNNPGLNISHPSTLSNNPGLSISHPSTLSNNPGPSIGHPSTLSNNPGLSNSHPSTLSNNPGLSISQPSTVSNPSLSNSHPTTLSNNPGPSISHPATLSNNPDPSISHPSTLSNNPDLSISHPSTVSNNPGLSISHPATLSNNPGLSISHPATLSNNPGVNISHPSTVSNNPGLNISHPSTVSNNPGPSISHPSTLSNNPGLSISHPATLSNNPGLSNSHPSTLSNNPGLSISHPATLSNNPGPSNSHPATLSNNPGPSISHPSTLSNNPDLSISHPATLSNNPDLSISHPSTVSNPGLSNSHPSTVSNNPGLSISHPATLSNNPALSISHPSTVSNPGLSNSHPSTLSNRSSKSSLKGTLDEPSTNSWYARTFNKAGTNSSGTGSLYEPSACSSHSSTLSDLGQSVTLSELGQLATLSDLCQTGPTLSDLCRSRGQPSTLSDLGQSTGQPSTLSDLGQSRGQPDTVSDLGQSRSQPSTVNDPSERSSHQEEINVVQETSKQKPLIQELSHTPILRQPVSNDDNKEDATFSLEYDPLDDVLPIEGSSFGNIEMNPLTNTGGMASDRGDGDTGCSTSIEKKVEHHGHDLQVATSSLVSAPSSGQVQSCTSSHSTGKMAEHYGQEHDPLVDSSSLTLVSSEVESCTSSTSSTGEDQPSIGHVHDPQVDSSSLAPATSSGKVENCSTSTEERVEHQPSVEHEQDSQVDPSNLSLAASSGEVESTSLLSADKDETGSSPTPVSAAGQIETRSMPSTPTSLNKSTHSSSLLSANWEAIVSRPTPFTAAGQIETRPTPFTAAAKIETTKPMPSIPVGLSENTHSSPLISANWEAIVSRPTLFTAPGQIQTRPMPPTAGLNESSPLLSACDGQIEKPLPSAFDGQIESKPVPFTAAQQEKKHVPSTTPGLNESTHSNPLLSANWEAIVSRPTPFTATGQIASRPMPTTSAELNEGTCSGPLLSANWEEIASRPTLFTAAWKIETRPMLTTSAGLNESTYSSPLISSNTEVTGSRPTPITAAGHIEKRPVPSTDAGLNESSPSLSACDGQMEKPLPSAFDGQIESKPVPFTATAAQQEETRSMPPTSAGLNESTHSNPLLSANWDAIVSRPTPFTAPGQFETRSMSTTSAELNESTCSNPLLSANWEEIASRPKLFTAAWKIETRPMLTTSAGLNESTCSSPLLSADREEIERDVPVTAARQEETRPLPSTFCLSESSLSLSASDGQMERPVPSAFDGQIERPVLSTFEGQIESRPAPSTTEVNESRTSLSACDGQIERPVPSTVDWQIERPLPSTSDRQIERPLPSAFEGQIERPLPSAFEGQIERPLPSAFDVQIESKPVTSTFDRQNESKPMPSAFDGQIDRPVPSTSYGKFESRPVTVIFDGQTEIEIRSVPSTSFGQIHIESGDNQQLQGDSTSTFGTHHSGQTSPILSASAGQIEGDRRQVYPPEWADTVASQTFSSICLQQSESSCDQGYHTRSGQSESYDQGDNSRSGQSESYDQGHHTRSVQSESYDQGDHTRPVGQTENSYNQWAYRSRSEEPMQVDSAHSLGGVSSCVSMQTDDGERN